MHTCSGASQCIVLRIAPGTSGQFAPVSFLFGSLHSGRLLPVQVTCVSDDIGPISDVLDSLECQNLQPLSSSCSTASVPCRAASLKASQLGVECSMPDFNYTLLIAFYPCLIHFLSLNYFCISTELSWPCEVLCELTLWALLCVTATPI